MVFLFVEPVCLGADTLQENILYQMMPISFYDSNGDSIGDFNGIVEAIPYLQNLGITGVWLNPVFKSKTYHGYQYVCNDTLNSRFGTETEFIQMVEALHDVGMKIFIDLVAYGVGTDNAMFQEARNHPESEWDLWFAFQDQNNATW
jgi:alpha-glucosidase